MVKLCDIRSRQCTTQIGVLGLYSCDRRRLPEHDTTVPKHVVD